MSTATATATALPYPAEFEETWNWFRPHLRTPRNRALFEAAWLTPDSELKVIDACFEWAAESWDRDSGEMEQLVWDAFISSDNSDYGEKFKSFSMFALHRRPGDVTEDGAELPAS